MSSVFGKNIKISIFGQSHSPAIGVTLDGIPAGVKIDFDALQDFLARRAPGTSEFTTPRKEADIPEFLCGACKRRHLRGADYSDHPQPRIRVPPIMRTCRIFRVPAMPTTLRA